MQQRAGDDVRKVAAIFLCLAVLVAAVMGGPKLVRAARRASRAERPNAVLLLLDTTRYDVCGWHGATPQSPTPNLDSLSLTGTAYLACQAQSSWTLPSMATIYTGLSERAHGAGSRGGELYGLSEEHETLAELIDALGYDSYAVFNVPVMDEPFGFWQGYDDVFPYVTQGSRVALDADTVVDIGLEWLDGRGDDVDPFFLTLHFFDPHYPYDPPAEYWEAVGVQRPRGGYNCASVANMLTLARDGELEDSELELLARLYLGEVAFMDAEIGRFLRGLRERGYGDNTVVVAIADHGEEFMEHGLLFHGRQLYQETVHVPWVMAGPGVGEGLRVTTPVGQYDLLPTLLDALGGEPPDYVEGCVATPDEVAHASVPTSGDITGSLEQAVLRMGDGKVFWSPHDSLTYAYFVGGGQIEREELAIDSLDPALYDSVARYWATPTVLDPMYVPEGAERGQRLRDLGYIR